jgi:hypothetical protein
VRQRRSQESGFAFLLALGLIVLVVAMTLVVLQNGATQHRRQVEEEAIWRGNQYARAIRLYFHKTGHYPQDLDALQKGLPEMHFLRQAYKDPTNTADGTWRFVYVNSAGQIIGSTRYATLQQMALMDANGGQLPTVPGAPGLPGVPASSLGDPNNNLNSQPGQPSVGATGTDTSNLTGSATTTNIPPDGQTPQPPDGQNPQSPTGQNPQNPQNPQNSQNPQYPTAGPTGQNPVGSQNPQAPLQTGLLGQGGAVTQASLAALALLKPTGPVDGPVLGAFLTGVASKQDAPSVKVYHGGKKYINWEFIWNPLEDAAAAMQQQAGNAGTNGIGQNVQGAFGGVGTNNGAYPGQQNPSLTQPPPQNPQSPQ